jgi:hypothetical protein
MDNKRGSALALVISLAIIVLACAIFYFTNDQNTPNTISLSPEEHDGLHLECVNICGNSNSTNSSCYSMCQYAFGEGPDLCDPIGSTCLMP